MTLTRRNFLAGGTALILPLLLPEFDALAETHDKTYLNAWLKVTSNDEFQFVLDRVEMGQGTMTSHVAMIAEELDVLPERFKVVFADPNDSYRNPLFKGQLTGGSSSTAASLTLLRKAGAEARERLLKAAQKKWKVKTTDLETHNGVIKNKITGETLRYGEVVAAALKEKGSDLPLKTKNFRVIGKPQPRLDAKAKSTGKAVYGIDVDIPNLSNAYILRAPAIEGKIKSFDAKEAIAAGAEVFQITRGLAVVARDHWTAKKLGQTIKIEWDIPAAISAISSDEIQKQFTLLLDVNKGTKVEKVGEALPPKACNLESNYNVPYLAHATLEPQNCTAWFHDGTLEIWAPTQYISAAQVLAKDVSGLSLSKIKVHQTYLGGGFGRRLPQDYVFDAVELAMKSKKPVKVVWTREDDMKNDFYRPASSHRLYAAFRDDKIHTWRHQIVSQSILVYASNYFLDGILNNFPKLARDAAKATMQKVSKGMSPDNSASEGTIGLEYEIPNRLVTWTFQETNVPIGFWRAVGHSYTNFVVESFFDECAAKLKKDPVAMRLELLSKADRKRKVLELAVEKSGYKPHSKRLGVAVGEAFKTYVAMVAEVEVVGTDINVKRIVAAIDCGFVVNPDIATAQVEGGIIFGLSAVLLEKITIENGVVQQSNFHDFPVLRMSQVPKIEVHFVESESPSTGVGEPGVVAVGASVANAIFEATGVRLRSMPFTMPG